MRLRFSIIYLVSFSLIILSCNRDHKQFHKFENQQNIIDSTKNDSQSKANFCNQKDTITALGTSIKYVGNNGEFRIKYRNSDFSRISDSVYTCHNDPESGIWDFVPKFEIETKNALVFRNILYTSSGGDPSPLEYCAIIFPKNQTDIIYQRDYYIECFEKYIVYGSAYVENLYIENLDTKQIQHIILKPTPFSFRTPTMSILDLKLINNKLSIRYEFLNENQEIEELDMVFDIKI